MDIDSVIPEGSLVADVAKPEEVQVGRVHRRRRPKFPAPQLDSLVRTVQTGPHKAFCTKISWR